MPSRNYLVFDFGASNGRAMVAQYDGEKIDIKEVHRFENRPVFAGGTLYWDILRLYSELKIGIQKSVKEFKDISSMGINSWAIDFGFLDKNGKLISNPYNYRDQSRSGSEEEVFKLFPREELFKLTGGMLIPIMSLFQIYYFIKNGAVEITSGKKFLMIPDIFNYFLTGEVFNEFTNFTTTLMYNQGQKRVEEKIIEKIGLSKDIFPEMIIPGTYIGDLKKPICDKLEINKIPVIAPATHDSASAIAGIPVQSSHKCWAFLSIGTWCFVGIETDSPVINEKVLKTGFANLGGVEGRNLLSKDITGLWIIQQCREKWIKEMGKNISWDEIVKFSDTARDIQSFIDVDDPDFSEPSTDMPQKVIEACRRRGQDVPRDIGEIARCIYQSMVMKFKLNFKLLEDVISEKIETLHIIGGGIYNKSLCQWIADATGIFVYAGPAETTSIGNALMQLKNSGEIKTLEDGRTLSLNSSVINCYEPRDTGKWGEAYEGYKELLGQ